MSLERAHEDRLGDHCQEERPTTLLQTLGAVLEGLQRLKRPNIHAVLAPVPVPGLPERTGRAGRLSSEGSKHLRLAGAHAGDVRCPAQGLQVDPDVVNVVCRAEERAGLEQRR